MWVIYKVLPEISSVIPSFTSSRIPPGFLQKLLPAFLLDLLLELLQILLELLLELMELGIFYVIFPQFLRDFFGYSVWGVNND